MYVSFFIEPLKGQEAIKYVLIVIEIFYQISPPHPSIYTTAEDEWVLVGCRLLFDHKL